MQIKLLLDYNKYFIWYVLNTTNHAEKNFDVAIKHSLYSYVENDGQIFHRSKQILLTCIVKIWFDTVGWKMQARTLGIMQVVTLTDYVNYAVQKF